jgi:hypothetical protein
MFERSIVKANEFANEGHGIMHYLPGRDPTNVGHLLGALEDIAKGGSDNIETVDLP